MKKTKEIKKWTAYYTPRGRKKEFDTKKQAEDYVISRNCDMCKGEGLGSMCACEWEILKSKELSKCKSLNDIFKASGWKEMKNKNELTKIINKK